MNIVYSDTPILEEYKQQVSIFLAGPSPRSKSVPSWRTQALKLLESGGFSGVVWLPEPRINFCESFNYINQVEWEYEALHNSDLIMFWVPRVLKTLPGFTTNVEFGYWVGRKHGVFYGRPDKAPKTAYLDWLYEKKRGRKPHNNLVDLVDCSLGWLDRNV